MSKKAAKAEEAAPTGIPLPYRDETAEAAEREEIVQSVATEVMGRMLSCGSCKYWARTGPSFGQCMLSGKYGSSPIITTDKASCSSWIE